MQKEGTLKSEKGSCWGGGKKRIRAAKKTGSLVGGPWQFRNPKKVVGAHSRENLQQTLTGEGKGGRGVKHAGAKGKTGSVTANKGARPNLKKKKPRKEKDSVEISLGAKGVIGWRDLRAREGPQREGDEGLR